jgi:hypothetical protein
MRTLAPVLRTFGQLRSELVAPGKAVIALYSESDQQLQGRIAALSDDPDIASVRVLYRQQSDTNPDDWAVSETISSPAVGDTFTLSSLTNGVAYEIALAIVDNVGNEGRIGNIVEGTPSTSTDTDTDLDTELVPEVLALINELGKQAVFHVPGTETYDPTTGDVTRVDSNYTKRVTPPEGYNEKFIDGDLIRAGDKKIYVAASGLGFTPKAGHKVTLDAVVWKVHKATPIYTGKQVAVWELQIRD